MRAIDAIVLLAILLGALMIVNLQSGDRECRYVGKYGEKVCD